MATMRRDRDLLLADFDACYAKLDEKFGKSVFWTVGGHGLLTISAVLTQSKADAETKCDKLFALYDALKERNIELNCDRSIAALSICDLPTERIVELSTVANDIMEINRSQYQSISFLCMFQYSVLRAFV